MDIRKRVVELIGTFIFVLTIGLTVVAVDPVNGAIAPLAIGASLMVMVDAGGHISGGAFNPAIATELGTMGLAKWPHVVVLVMSNVVGGIIAGLLFRFLNSHDLEPLTPQPATPAEPAHRPARRNAGR